MSILIVQVVGKGVNVTLGLKDKLCFIFSCRRACIRAKVFLILVHNDLKLTGKNKKKTKVPFKAIKVN